MATAALSTRFQPIYNRNRNKETTPMTKRDLTPIIEKVKQLKELTRTTGFHTTRSIAALMADLSPDETAEVAKAVNLTSNQR